MLTIDQNIKHEQNLTVLPLAVVVMNVVSNRLDDVAQCVPAVEEVLRTLQPRTLVEVCPPSK